MAILTGILMAGFVTGDFLFPGYDTRGFKLASVILIAFMSLSAENRRICQCLFLTIVCDIFLLFIPRCYVPGLCLFSLVHILYTEDITRCCFPQNKKRRKRIFLLLLPLLFLFSKNALYTAALIYAVCMLLHFCFSFRADSLFKTRYTQLHAIGMVCFLFCDICTGLSQFPPFYSLGKWIWIFYTPALLLIEKSGAYSAYFPPIE